MFYNKDVSRSLNPWVFGLMLFISLALLLFRVDSLTLFSKPILWAEDGTIFINQAHSGGVSAIWNAYMGYFHLYSRLFAAGANFLPLITRPYLLFFGWLVAYLFMISVLIQRLHALGVSKLALFMLLAFVCLQPTSSAMFFVITNSQWMLGTAFALLVATTLGRIEFSIPKCVLLFVLCFSGPFSVVLLPVVLLRAVVLKDVKVNAWAYAVFFLCVLPHLIEVFSAGRLTHRPLDVSFSHWTHALNVVLMFSQSVPCKNYISLLFWVLFFFGLFGFFKDSRNCLEEKFVVVMLLLCAMLFLVVAFIVARQSPLSMAGYGNRYTWIPYTLIFVSAVMASRSFRVLQYWMMAVIAFLCFTHITRYDKPDFQFSSFVNFGKYKALTIPINPSWPKYPAWYINSTQELLSLETTLVKARVDLDSAQKIVCKDARDVGIEVQLAQSQGDWATLTWSSKTDFSMSESMNRWYPEGDVTMYFAFPYPKEGVAIRLSFGEELESREIKAVTAYCLP